MILEAIYNGDFYPSETVVPKSEKYRNALRACEKIMDQLAQRLTKEDYDLVETLLDQSSIAQCEESECHFKVGFSAGLLVQQEAEKQIQTRAMMSDAKATGALLTRVTVVPTQPIETLILLRSERTVYIVSNS